MQKFVIKYGLNVKTKQEGWIILERTEKKVNFYFSPITDEDRIDLFSLKKKIDIRVVPAQEYELAIFCTSLVETDENYANFNGNLIGNTKEENLEFWIKPVVVEIY